MATEAPQFRRNDHRPELVDGKASDRQLTSERALIFTRVLRGLGVSRQVSRFIWTIYTITKPGKEYRFNDPQLAEFLGCEGDSVSRNYVSSLRRKMREWNNSGYDDHGTKHYSFVSVVENTYDPKTKKQNPTGYIFSQEFADKLEYLHAKVRLHHRYQDNWIVALNDVCDLVGRTEFTEFGFWNYRKERRPRPVEEILGTLLLNWKRATRRLVSTAIQFGYDREDVSAYLRALAPSYIHQAADNILIFGPKAIIKVPGAQENDFQDGEGNHVTYVPIKANRQEFMATWDKVFKYVVQKEYGEIVDFAEAKAKKEKKQHDRSSKRWSATNEPRRETDQAPGRASVGLPTGLEPWTAIPVLQSEPLNEIMDQQRERFLAIAQKIG